MWNIWVQNDAVKNIQESSEIDHKEGEILISAHTATPGKSAVCDLVNGSMVVMRPKLSESAVHAWRLVQSQQHWILQLKEKESYC